MQAVAALSTASEGASSSQRVGKECGMHVLAKVGGEGIGDMCVDDDTGEVLISL